MLGFKIFEFVWTGQLSYPQYLCRAPGVRGFLPSQWKPRPREKPQPRFRQQHVSLERLLACGQALLFGRAPWERANEGQSREGPPPPPSPRVRVFLSRASRTSTFNDIPKRRACSQATILVKTFGTLCVLGEENVIQVDPPPPWTVLGVTSQTPFTYLVHFKDLNFV